jgi:tetratricopeptide (TPR) repeat protein
VAKKKFIDAYCVYDEAIRMCKDSKDKVLFLLNKAIMCSKLNLKEEYRQYIEEVLKIDPKN